MQGELRIASLNMRYGGLDGGDDSRWRKQMDHLAAWDPDVVLLQEMAAPTAAGLLDHLWRTANELGMMPVLGPATPYTTGRTYPAIMVRRAAGWLITSSGPPLWEPGCGEFPAWCQATVQTPVIPHPVAFYSMHLPARSAQRQLGQVQQLTSVVAERRRERGEIAVAGGGFNCLACADKVTPEELEAMPEHLRPPRMRGIRGLDGSIRLVPNYAIDHELATIGLVDVAARLPPGKRGPAQLSGTTAHGGEGRPDQFRASKEVADAVVWHETADTGASDHKALLMVMDACAVAGIEPREAAG
jgi:endonuclease/exonuclease/phosphatase family metal-dependent hydrolase